MCVLQAAEVERQLSTQVHSLRDDFREKSMSTSQHMTRLESLQAEVRPAGVGGGGCSCRRTLHIWTNEKQSSTAPLTGGEKKCRLQYLIVAEKIKRLKSLKLEITQFRDNSAHQWSSFDSSISDDV